MDPFSQSQVDNVDIGVVGASGDPSRRRRLSVTTPGLAGVGRGAGRDELVVPGVDQVGVVRGHALDRVDQPAGSGVLVAAGEDAEEITPAFGVTLISTARFVPSARLRRTLSPSVLSVAHIVSLRATISRSQRSSSNAV